MSTFRVVYVKGRALGTGLFAQFEPLTGQTMYSVETTSRASAYVKAYQHLAKFGLGVFAMKDTAGDGNPLGFSEAEMKVVQDAEIPFDSRPRSGFRIEKIVWEK